MILGDFHIHSTFSDGKLSIPQLVDLYGSQGFGVIAITDHICEEKGLIGVASSYVARTLTPATFPLYQEILRSEAERAWDRYRMVVLPGYELSKNSVFNHRSAHIVGIGISEFMWADADSKDLARNIRSQGGVAIAAHPVSTRKFEKQTYHLWDRREELAQEFDAWEVASGPFLFDEVAQSKLPMIASSDLHDPRQMTSWKTWVDAEKSPEAILDAIRQQKLNFQFYSEDKNSDSDHTVSLRSLGARFNTHRDGYLLGA